MHGLFITGVGKTRIGTTLAHCLVERGVRVRARKPVESGCAHGSALRRTAGTGLPLLPGSGDFAAAPVLPVAADHLKRNVKATHRNGYLALIKGVYEAIHTEAERCLRPAARRQTQRSVFLNG